MLTKKKLSLISVLFIVILVVVTFSLITSDKTLSKNYGVSHMTINNGVPTTDIDSVVPSKNELIQSLKKEGYSITPYSVITHLNIPVERIYAEKNNSFIDISYTLSTTDAKNVFEYYEGTYEEYYLLAQNEGYVYCISDKKTFKNAGFESLANIGVQYIYD